MPRYPVALLHRMNPNWRDLTVDVVTFPAPPVAAKGYLYTPDGWHSSTLDRAEDLFPDSTVRAVAMTAHGPAFVLRKRLAAFIDDNGYINPIYCATISFENGVSTGGVTFAKAAILERCNKTMSSCHPGSHTAVPWAPFLTLLCGLSNARWARAGADYRYTDDVTAEELFPAVSFMDNQEVDRLFRYANLTQAFVEYKSVKFAIPNSLSPRLRRLVQQKLVGNENLARHYGGDTKQYMQVVDLRNQLQETENGR